MRTRWTCALCLSLVLTVTALAYLPSLQNEFTNWDESLLVVENSSIQGLTWTNIREIFTSLNVEHYHPLTTLSFAVEYHFFRLDPRPYHVVNLALHLLNCLLVFRLVALLGGGRIAACAAALLFGIHPLHVEAVAWIAARKDVLSGVFFLGSLIAYLHARRREGGWRSYLLSLALLFCSLLSKAIGISAPFVLLLFDYLAGRKIDRKSLLEKAPFFALAAVFALLAFFTQRSAGAIRDVQLYPLSQNVLIATHGILFYLVKTFLPLRLSAVYPFPVQPGEALPLRFLLSPLAVAALAGVVIASRRHSRKIVFGALFFFVTLLPVLQLVPVGHSIAADRFTYLPSIGLFYLAGVGLAALVGKGARASRQRQALLWAAVAAIAVTFGWLTRERALVWRDSITLWSDVIDKHPGSSLAYVNRGHALAERGEKGAAGGGSAAALADFNAAIERSPRQVEAYLSRGSLHADRGEDGKALADYAVAIDLDPARTEAYTLRGNLFLARKDYRAAIRDYSLALAADPDYAAAYANRGIAHEALGDADAAIDDHTRAIAGNPTAAAGYFNRGNAYRLKGAYRQAIADYGEAARLRPGYARAFNNRGIAHAALKDYREAVADFSRALAIDPLSADAYYNRGIAHGALGEQRQARADYDAALRIEPRLLQRLGVAPAAQE